MFSISYAYLKLRLVQYEFLANRILDIYWRNYKQKPSFTTVTLSEYSSACIWSILLYIYYQIIQFYSYTVAMLFQLNAMMNDNEYCFNSMCNSTYGDESVNNLYTVTPFCNLHLWNVGEPREVSKTNEINLISFYWYCFDYEMFIFKGPNSCVD